jgi:rSAM/selenodomain-associated transferase 1
MRARLILFARAPQLGGGKRRLAHDIGAVRAVRFERLMLGSLLRRLGRDRRWRLRLAVTPDCTVRRARHSFGLGQSGIEAVGQGPGDLGRRRRRALAQAPPGPAVLIGADIPAVQARHIAAAFRLLGRHDLVFGPAADGGFWLIGARRRPRLPPLFACVRWSSPDALADTLRGLPRGVSVGFVDTLEDVDGGAAYRRFRGALTHLAPLARGSAPSPAMRERGDHRDSDGG